MARGFLAVRILTLSQDKFAYDNHDDDNDDNRNNDTNNDDNDNSTNQANTIDDMHQTGVSARARSMCKLEIRGQVVLNASYKYVFLVVISGVSRETSVIFRRVLFQQLAS